MKLTCGHETDAPGESDRYLASASWVSAKATPGLCRNCWKYHHASPEVRDRVFAAQAKVMEAALAGTLPPPVAQFPPREGQGRAVAKRAPTQPPISKAMADRVATRRIELRIIPCHYRGKVTDRKNCYCQWKWVRECEKHGSCTLSDQRSGHATCSVCPDYEPDDPGATADDGPAGS